MSVTREMIAAGHAVTMKRGDVILSADLLTAIYKAMAARRPRVTYVCEVCNAGMVPALGELGSAQEVCDCKAADMIERQQHVMQRAMDAWDTTTHQKNGDGRLWQCMEELRGECGKQPNARLNGQP